MFYFLKYLPFKRTHVWSYPVYIDGAHLVD